MATADIINAVAAGTTVSTAKKVGKGKKAVELTVTRTAPEVQVVDETVKDEPTGTLPVDAGKRTVEVLPGLKLVVYSKGYVCLRMKGKAWGGNKVDIGKPLYRDDIKALVEALFTEGQNAKTYAEANGIAAAPVGDAADFENVPF
jgi:hypothetical protein